MPTSAYFSMQHTLHAQLRQQCWLAPGNLQLACMQAGHAGTEHILAHRLQLEDVLDAILCSVVLESGRSSDDVKLESFCSAGMQRVEALL